jgi:hypothetical protein
MTGKHEFKDGHCKEKCDYWCEKNKCEKDGKHKYENGKCQPKY